MLEVMREYKSLATKRRDEGSLPSGLAERFAELEALIRQHRAEQPGPAAPTPPVPAPIPRTASRLPLDLAQQDEAEPPDDTLDLPAPAPEPQPLLQRWVHMLHLPTDPQGQRRAGVALAILAALACFGTSTLFGASFAKLAPGLMIAGGLGWFILFPALLAWWEFRGRRSSAYLREPDFEVRLPNLERAVAVLSLLIGVVWLMANEMSGEGLSATIGYLLGMALGLAAIGGVAAMVFRPPAARFARARAYTQYIAGGTHHLDRNPRRARRLFERAVAAAGSTEEAQAAQAALQRATERQAEALHQRGLKGHAAELLKRNASMARPSTPAPTTPPPQPSTTLPPPGPARVLRLGEVRIQNTPSGHPDPTTLDHVQALERKGRCREALEMRLDANISISTPLAQAAAQEYIAQGVLRSSFVLQEALGRRQIPEFYKAVAVELTRTRSDSDLALTTRLTRVLIELGELEPAGRLATQTVTASQGDTPERTSLAGLAKQAYVQANLRVPGIIWKTLKDHTHAAEAFETEGNREEALLCHRGVADALLARRAPPNQLVPILSRLFLLDPTIEDTYLQPLAEHVIDTQASGPGALKVLATYRRRHPEDPRAVRRRFELCAQGGQIDDALAELEHLSGLAGSNPESTLEDYRHLATRFATHPGVQAGLCRALIRLSRIAEAALEVQRAIDGPEPPPAAVLIELISSLYEWGHVEPELRLELARLQADSGQRLPALQSLTKYLEDGGTTPEAADLAEHLYEGQLIAPSGAPHHRAHLQLALLHLYCGNHRQALQYLEVARGGAQHRADAELLIARAELMGAQPKRAHSILMAAIDGRHISKTPELHFELARLFESLGQTESANRIYTSLERHLPGFARRYLAERREFHRTGTGPLAHSEAPGTEVMGGPTQHTAGNTAAHTTADPDSTDVDPLSTALSEMSSLAEALAPRYRLIKRVGAGGMGDVHLAEDQALGREVAVKVLRRTLATDLFIAKFREEARTVAKLSHPAIVGVYDIGQEGDWSFIVMEYVRGPNLATLLRASAPPPPSELITYIAQVADAMQYAHSQGVIHRDLKPANLLVSMDGRVKVTDFGIARVLQENDEQTAFSAAGLQVGTINYMAPEQITGGPLGPHTDIYLLGTTLYYCLARRYPYSGEAPLAQKLREPPTPLETYYLAASAQLQALVLRCLQRDHTQRFASMSELAQSLRALPDLGPAGS